MKKFYTGLVSREGMLSLTLLQNHAGSVTSPLAGGQEKELEEGLSLKTANFYSCRSLKTQARKSKIKMMKISDSLDCKSRLSFARKSANRT